MKRITELTRDHVTIISQDERLFFSVITFTVTPKAFDSLCVNYWRGYYLCPLDPQPPQTHNTDCPSLTTVNTTYDLSTNHTLYLTWPFFPYGTVYFWPDSLLVCMFVWLLFSSVFLSLTLYVSKCMCSIHKYCTEHVVISNNFNLSTSQSNYS